MEVKIGKHFITKTGELFTVIALSSEEIKLQLFNTNFVIRGEPSKFYDWQISTEAAEVNSEEYIKYVEMAKQQKEKKDDNRK